MTQTQILPATFLRPVPQATQLNWVCNGSINPLLRTVEQLKQAAGENFPEAVRWLSMRLPDDPCAYPSKAHTDVQLDEIAARGLEVTRTPVWRRDNRAILPGIFTTAQMLAKRGNLDCRALCADIHDLTACFDLMGSYNNFDACAAGAAFHKFNKAQYYGPDNCNTGHDAYRYWFGWEGSHVVYIQALFLGKYRVLTPDWLHEHDLLKADFVALCQSLARQTEADESDEDSHSDNCITWRLWWD